MGHRSSRTRTPTSSPASRSGTATRPDPAGGRSTGRPSSSTNVPPSLSPYPMTSVGSSRAAARRSRNVVPSARSPRSITRRVSASRDHPPQRRSMASAAVLRISRLAERIRAVAKSSVPAADTGRDQGKHHGHRGRHDGCAHATAPHRSLGRGRGDVCRSRPRPQEHAVDSGEAEWGRDQRDHIARRDDRTLGQALEAASRIRHEEMHEEAQVHPTRHGRQRADEPREPGREVEVRDTPGRWDAKRDDSRTMKVRPTATSNPSTVRSAFGLACHSTTPTTRPLRARLPDDAKFGLTHHGAWCHLGRTAR